MGLINSLYNGSGGRSAQILRSPTQAVDCEAVRKWHRRACPAVSSAMGLATAEASGEGWSRAWFEKNPDLTKMPMALWATDNSEMHRRARCGLTP